MKSKDALALAKERWGKDAFVRDNGMSFHDGELRPLDAEDRAKLQARYNTHCDAQPLMKALENWPDDTPLGEYKTALTAHKKAWAKWKKTKDTLQGKCLTHRFDVGHLSQLGFRVIEGSGDTWEEALRKARCLPE